MDNFFKIVIGVPVAIYWILFAVLWVGMFVRFAWVLIQAYRERGAEGLKMSIEGDPSNDVD